ncbi:cysteine desulfurase, partial [Candidatus Woesearchaeota archaeon]|nr:cysteine desulfurase [Candidatus Woesearchaeota archaeon]
MPIYLDTAATTPIDLKVLSVMNHALKEDYGNPSSIHKKGQEAKEHLEKARKTIAKSINALPEEIYFTSSGTEANNLALRGILATTKKKEIITSVIEHSSILSLCQQLEKEGYKVHYIPVTKEGLLNLKVLEQKINSQTALVSIMYVNNEIGTIQNIELIGKMCAKKSIPFHTDAIQAFKKVYLDVKKQTLTLVSLSAHKIYGPKGIAALYVKKATLLKPLLYGGKQEQGLRPGTENLASILGFAKAVELSFPVKELERKKKYVIQQIKKEIPQIKINGSEKHSICTIINLSIKGIEA